MRRASRCQTVLLPGLGIAVPLAAILVATSGGGGSPESVPVTPLLDASDIVTHGPGYQFKMTITATLEEDEKPSAFGVEGTVDKRGQQGAMTFEAAGRQLAEIYRPAYVYVRTPNGRLADGKPWLRLDVDALEEALGESGGPEDGSDGPRRFIASLNSAANATLIGHESVAGEPTTHYHARVNLKHYATTVCARERVAAERFSAMLQ